LTSRNFNIFCIALILVWIWADRYFRIGSPAYGWLLLLYVSVLFCGSYFIRLGYFFKSVNGVKTKEKVVALTFDDGPVHQATSEILDLLKEHNTEAAFFCIGKNIPGNEDLLKRMIKEGHMIGNHSYTHDHFFDLFGSAKMLRDIEEMSRSCRIVTGYSPRLFRPPFGVTNPNLKRALQQGKFVSVGWSIRSFDTIIRDEKRLLDRIFRRLKPGTILLLHDTSQTTKKILVRLLKGISERGYKTIRLDKMTNLIPYD
jgi:peptidoglycan-N-acetylglucosamine deacetylase